MSREAVEAKDVTEMTIEEKGVNDVEIEAEAERGAALGIGTKILQVIALLKL